MHPHDGRVVSNFIVQALLGQDMTIYGDGSQTRSFCFVSDLIDGLVKLMATPPAVTGPVNIGNPHEFTILELAKLTIELTNSHSRIVRRPLPQDDPKQRQPDITLAKKLFNFSPSTALKEGLLQTIEYFDRLLRDEKIRASLIAEPDTAST